MKEKSESFTVFPKWDLTVPKIQSRSKLFSIQPMYVGTRIAESFTSYFTRLSYEHCVSPISLMRYVLKQTNPRLLAGEISYNRLLNGTNSWASLLNNALISLLPYEDIKYTTLLAIKDSISSPFLLRVKKLWCPLCLEEQKQNNQTVYEHLVWSLSMVEVCSIHRITLIDKCPHCNLNSNSASGYPYGYCNFCFNWLGYSGKSKERNKLKFKEKTVSKLIWIDKELRKLIEFLPLAETQITEKHYKIGIRELIDYLGNGSINSFCRKLKINEFDLTKLLFDRRQISLTQLMNICYPLRLSPVSLLTGKIDIKYLLSEDEKSRKIQANLMKIAIPKTKKATEEKIKAAQEIMLASLEEEIPPAFNTICKKVGIDRLVLIRMLPGLSSILRDRYLEYKKNLNKNRWL